MIETKLEDAMQTLHDASDVIYSMITDSMDADGTVYVPGAKALSTMIGAIETELWRCCRAIETMYVASDHAQRSDGAVLTDIRRCGDAIIAYAPTLHRLRKPRLDSGMICAPLMDLCAERCVSLPTDWDAVDVTVLTIYPQGTIEQQIADPDNIAPKRVIDDVLYAMGLDDNGMRVTLHIDAMYTDDVRPGAYVVITRRGYPGPRHGDTVIDAIMRAYRKKE